MRGLVIAVSMPGCVLYPTKPPPGNTSPGVSKFGPNTPTILPCTGMIRLEHSAKPKRLCRPGPDREPATTTTTKLPIRLRSKPCDKHTPVAV